MPVRVQDNSLRVITDMHRGVNLALRFMLDDIDRTASPKTPKKEGSLRGDVLKRVLGLAGEIVWLKGYAAAQEVGTTRGSPIRNYTTPGTGAHYAENAVIEVAKRADTHFRKARIA
jgi:hypothetical protein